MQTALSPARPLTEEDTGRLSCFVVVFFICAGRISKKSNMETLLLSTGVVALAEMGDKTQLLAFILASRFKKPVPIILGILVATIFNHGLAGALGSWLMTLTSPENLRWIMAACFIAMAVWIMIPDKMDDGGVDHENLRKLGVFGITLVTFFLAEMGDKTQIATVMLTVNYGVPFIVVMGTTIGMLIADVPAVFVGDKLSEKIPVKWMRIISAALFAAIGVITAVSFNAG